MTVRSDCEPATGLITLIYVFMKQKFIHDSRKNIQRVLPGCSPDLTKAIRTGVIPATGTTSDYNGLEELSDIGKRVREPFDVIHFDREYSRIERQIESRKKSKDSGK